MEQLRLALAGLLSGLIGLSLGLLGGGGSILAVPVLVYVAGLPAAAAVATSLALVGATSLWAALLHAREGRVDARAALLFGGSGAAGAGAGSLLTPMVSARTLLLLFGAVTIAAGARMLRAGSGGTSAPPATPAARGSVATLLLAGAAVGVVTGFLGVGGGFLVVPALVLVAGLPMRTAVGTSLVVISLNTGAGLLGHLGGGGLRPGLTASLTLAALAGAFAGERLSRRATPAGLRRAFAALVLLVGAGVVVKNLLAP